MLNAGVSGYFSKTERAENLIAAIRRAARGEFLFTPEQLGRALKWNREEGKKWESLTKRERQVLMLLEEGLENKLIAERLCISLKTEEQYVSGILEKLSVHSRQEASGWFTKNIPEELRDNPE
jgi:DNA-binding NarL/FixJ family response regulator